MVKAVVYVAQGGDDRFPAGPRALLSWFQSGRKRIRKVIHGHFFREVTFSIFDQRDGEKDDVTMVKRPSMLFKRWHRWRSVNGFDNDI